MKNNPMNLFDRPTDALKVPNKLSDLVIEIKLVIERLQLENPLNSQSEDE